MDRFWSRRLRYYDWSVEILIRFLWSVEILIRFLVLNLIMPEFQCSLDIGTPEWWDKVEWFWGFPQTLKLMQ